MAYDINSYISSIQSKRKSPYSPFGGRPSGGSLFGRINSGISSFVNRGTAIPQASSYKPPVQTQPNSTSAVGSNSGVAITPPKQPNSVLPTSGQQYVNSISSSAPKPASPTVAPATTQSPTAESEDAYISYLKTLFNPESSKLALTEKENAMKRLADIQSQTETKDLAARREYEAKLDESGGLREGAQASATASARRSNQELADLAVQESAAARSAQVASDTYNEYINAGKTVFEAETAAKDAAEKAKQQVFENDLAMKKFEEDKRQFGMEYALAKQKASTTGTTSRNLNPTQLAAQNNANSALLSISNLTRDITDANGNIVPGKLFTLGLGKVGQAKREITDVISRVRTGAALTKEEESFYKKQIPRAIDNEATIRQKLNQLTAFYAGISGSPITLELPDGSVVVADDMFDSLTRTDVRQALADGANIISY